MLPSRRPMKTYSRLKRKCNDVADNAIKRRRAADSSLPSTTSRLEGTEYDSDEIAVFETTESDTFPTSESVIYSDNTRDASTPPSSPPPLTPPIDASKIPDDMSTPSASADREGLRPVSSNARITTFFQPVRKAIPSAPAPAPRPKLVQMQINLGLTSQKVCKTCGMTYVPSNAEDSALHNKFHQQNQQGVELGKAFRKKYESLALWRGRDSDIVVCVDLEKAADRKKVVAVLDIAQGELGAVHIPEEELVRRVHPRDGWEDNAAWILLSASQKASAEDEKSKFRRESVLQYQAYLYMTGTKCVGLCLAERVATGHEVLEPAAGQTMDNDGPIVVRETASSALVGVSRIWTSSSHRRKGIASALLDGLSHKFDNSGPVPKDQLAFSQPTTSGAKLAKKWYGRNHGWLVYKD